MMSLDELAKRYPPEYLDLDRLHANLAVIDQELANFKMSLPLLRQQDGMAVEATKCSVLIGEHEVKRDELQDLIQIKREWLRGND